MNVVLVVDGTYGGTRLGEAWLDVARRGGAGLGTARFGEHRRHGARTVVGEQS